MAGLAEYQIRTNLTTRDIATTFREHIQGRAPGFIGFAWSRKVAWTFSTPPNAGNSFAEIDNIGILAFRVLAHHGLPKKPMFANDARLAQLSGIISLDIWDDNSYRVARIICLPGLGPKAHVELVLEQLKKRDLAAEITVA